jgi:hypothetical protein
MEANGILTSDDLNFLQSVYESAAADIANIDDAAMHDVIRTLIAHYRNGERDRETLIALAARDLQRATG